MSSSRPTNGLMMYAPALAASSACPGEKQSVTFTRRPSLLRALVAWIPSRVSGHFTTMFLWILASSLPSLIIAEASVDTTSALISPSTMSQIRRTCSAIGRPSFAISVGFVVTPSTMPQLAPFFNSSRFAVSRKIFTRLASGPKFSKVVPARRLSARLRLCCAWPTALRPLKLVYNISNVPGKTFYLETFGCQMNAHDSEKVVGTLMAQGYSQVETPEDAHLVLYN